MKYLAMTFATTGDPPEPAFIDVVKTLEFNPIAQYNYNGTYYYSYSWPAGTVGNGKSYAYNENVEVECLVNGIWVPYTTLNSTMVSVP